MAQENKKSLKPIIYTTILVSAILIILYFLLFSGAVGITPNQIETSSHGHGSSSQSGITAAMISLGIIEESDVTIDGTEYCINYDCWDRIDIEYDECVYRVEEDGSYDYESCDDAYDYSLINECNETCSEEVFIWDGTPVRDVNNFFETSYPDTYGYYHWKCEFWFFGGTWLDSTDEVGCQDFGFGWDREGFCNSNSIQSVKTVCEAIDKTWGCDDYKATCQN